MNQYMNIEDMDKASVRALRVTIWQRHGLRLRYVCKAKEACTWVIMRHASKANMVLGARHICAKVKRVSEALYWAKVYSVKAAMIACALHLGYLSYTPKGGFAVSLLFSF